MQIPGRCSRRERKMKGSKQAGNEIERPIALVNPIPNSSSFARSHARITFLMWRAALKKNNPNFFPFLITSEIRWIVQSHIWFVSRMLIILNNFRSDRYCQQFRFWSILTRTKFPFSVCETWNTIREDGKVERKLVWRGSKKSLFTESWDYCSLSANALSN